MAQACRRYHSDGLEQTPPRRGQAQVGGFQVADLLLPSNSAGVHAGLIYLCRRGPTMTTSVFAVSSLQSQLQAAEVHPYQHLLLILERRLGHPAAACRAGLTRSM